MKTIKLFVRRLIFQHIVVPTAVIKEVTTPGKKDSPARQFTAQDWLNPVADIPICLGSGQGRKRSHIVALSSVWGLARAGTAGTVSFAIVSRAFPVAMAGRANTALNLMVFVTSFLVQWGMGIVINLIFPQQRAIPYQIKKTEHVTTNGQVRQTIDDSNRILSISHFCVP